MTARHVLQLYLTQGQSTPYEATQVTQTFGPSPTESAQVVRRAGRLRQRVDYLAPSDQKGEVLLRIGRRLVHYVPGPPPRRVEAEASEHEAIEEVRDLLESVRTGRIRVKLVGQQMVAGRKAYILELRTEPQLPYRRLWIDSETGIRLRQERLDADGRVIAMAYLTSLTLSPRFKPRTFDPRALPGSEIGVTVPARRSFVSIAEAEREAGFSVKLPRVSQGFELDGIWVLGRGQDRTVLLRYRDGVNTFFLSQRPLRTGARPKVERIVNKRGGIPAGAQLWVSGDRLFMLLGHPDPRTRRLVRESLK